MTTIRKLALALVILVAGASCTADASPPATSLPDGVLPAAILGMAGPLGGQSVAGNPEARAGHTYVPSQQAELPRVFGNRISHTLKRDEKPA